jgi:hypothetical protein
MNRRIQPLSEQFIYCSPEAMSRELYRLCPVPGPVMTITGNYSPGLYAIGLPCGPHTMAGSNSANKAGQSPHE